MRQDASRNILWSNGNNNPASRRLNIQSRLNNLCWELRKKSLHFKFDDWKSRNNFLFPSTCSERRGSFCEGGKWSLSLYVSRELWKVCYDINRKSYYAWHVMWSAETTRMHSSRMRNGRSLTVCRGVPPSGGGSPSGVSLAEGVSLAGGAFFGGWGRGISFQGVSLAGGSPWQGASFWGVSFQGVSFLGGLLPWVSLVGSPWQGGLLCRGGIPACTEADPQGGLLPWGLLGRGVSLAGGASFWGVSFPGWSPSRVVSLVGGLLGRGSPRQGVTSQHALRHTPLWTEWQTGVKILPWPQLRCGR